MLRNVVVSASINQHQRSGVGPACTVVGLVLMLSVRELARGLLTRMPLGRNARTPHCGAKIHFLNGALPECFLMYSCVSKSSVQFMSWSVVISEPSSRAWLRLVPSNRALLSLVSSSLAPEKRSEEHTSEL